MSAAMRRKTPFSPSCEAMASMRSAMPSKIGPDVSDRM
jgi:hypothetical protein